MELYAEETDRLGKAPLFENGCRASGAGSGRRLHKRHALLLSLAHLYAGMHREALGAAFGIDQSAVSRYLALNLRALEEILPTPRIASKKIAKLGESEAIREYLPGGDLWLDGARCAHQRPNDKGAR